MPQVVGVVVVSSIVPDVPRGVLVALLFLGRYVLALSARLGVDRRGLLVIRLNSLISSRVVCIRGFLHSASVLVHLLALHEACSTWDDGILWGSRL